MRAHHDLGLPDRDRLVGGPASGRAERPGEQRDRDGHVGEQVADRLGQLACEQVGRGQQHALAARSRSQAQGIGRHGRLARADVALQQAQHGHTAGQIGADGIHGRRLVGRQADLPPDPPGQAVHDPRAHRGIAGGVGRDGCARLGVGTLAATSDHAHLQGQQLVACQPPDRRVALLEVSREVGRAHGLAEGRSTLPQ